MADLAAENQRLRDELRESSELMRRQCEVMKQVKSSRDADSRLMRQKHEQMKRLVMTLQRAMQQKDISPNNLLLFLHKMAAPGDMQGDVGNLKAQVFSLFHELKDLQGKYDAEMAHARQLAERNQALELQCRQYEENISKQRLDDDEVINALQVKMTDLETDLATQKRLADMANLEKSQVHSEFRKLFNDHHDLLNRADNPASQNLQLELERLKADHQVALQSLAMKESQIKELDEQVVIRTNQADVYKTDFYAERQAREEMNTLKENVTEELDQMKAENVRLRAMLAEQEASQSQPAKTYRCPKCQQIYVDMDTLQTHVLTCIN